jgi:hypothetical protein
VESHWIHRLYRNSCVRLVSCGLVFGQNLSPTRKEKCTLTWSFYVVGADRFELSTPAL